MNSQANIPIGREGQVYQYSLRDLLTIVFKRRWLILATLLTVVTVVMFVTLRMPRTYEVTATLLVNKMRAEVPIAATESAQVIAGQVSEQDLNTEIVVLTSRKLIEDVVRRLNAEEPLNFEFSSDGVGRSISAVSTGDDETQRSEINAMVSNLMGSLDISVIKKSNALQLSYVSTDPEWATRVVGTLTDEYLKQRVLRYQSPQTLVFFEQQMTDAEQRLKQHEQALEEFADEASITMVEGSAGSDPLVAQQQLVMERLSSLENSLGDAEVELESQRRQVASLQEKLRIEPERLESSNQMNLDATTGDLESALTAFRLERDRLLLDFKPDSRYVRDIDTQIKMAEDRLQQAREASSVSGTEPNPAHVQLKGQLLSAEVALDGIRARVSPLRRQVVEYRKQLDNLNARAFDFESLQRSAQAAEEDYLLYRKKHEEARISAAMDQEKFMNVTVAQPALIPLHPQRRQLAKKMFLSVLIGLLGGVALAFGMENYVNRSFTTAEDIERKLGIPHIASIPMSGLAG
jgi:uncharacterized protein involved in exopolysaccharide biosynthesis